MGKCLICGQPVYWGSPAVWVTPADAGGSDAYTHQACAMAKSAEDLREMDAGMYVQ